MSFTLQDLVDYQEKKEAIEELCERYLGDIAARPGNFDGISSFTINRDGDVDFWYGTYSRGCYDRDGATMPFAYVEDRDAFLARRAEETRLWEEQEKTRKAQQAEERAREKEQQERETYERLKTKFES